MIIDEETYLEHYGVLGMKWGVRKDRRASRQEASRERKAQKYELKAEVMQTKISELEKASGKTSSNPGTNAYYEKKILTREKDQALKDAKAKRDGELTDKQKQLIKGALIVTGVVAAYGVYTMVQSGEMNRMLIMGKSFINGNEPPGWKKNLELAKKMSADDIMKKVVAPINPGYGDIGTKVNCRRATFAYEMRRRGLDVAATKTTNSRGQDMSGLYNVLHPGADRVKSGRVGMLTELLEETTKETFGISDETPFIDFMNSAKGGLNKVSVDGVAKKASNNLFSALAKQPEGARGEVGVTWAMGGGHSVAYEIIGGKPVIFDAQSGTKYTKSKFLKELGDNISSAGYTRLDDVELNEDYLMRWLKDA